MKVDDFVTTGSEMNAAQQDLASTHMTDAVNSGIVGSADKSAMAIKADVMSSSSGTAAQQGAKKVVSTETAVSKASSMLQKQGSQLATDSVVNSKLTHRKLLSKANAKNAVKNTAIASTLEGSEFEGADDMFYKGKSAYKLGRKGASALQGKLGKKAAVDVSSGAGTAKKLGGLSEKKSMLKKSAESVQRKWQLVRNQQRLTTVKAASRNAGKAIAGKGAISALAGSALGSAAAVVGSILAVILAIVLAIAVFLPIGGGDGGDSDYVANGALPAACEIWRPAVTTACSDIGLDTKWVDAILAMMAAESGGDLNVSSVLGAKQDVMQAAEGCAGYNANPDNQNIIKYGSSAVKNHYNAKCSQSFSGNTALASIYAGVIEFRHSLEAQESWLGSIEPTDTGKVQLVWQGYNYGYAGWANYCKRNNIKEWSLSASQRYSSQHKNLGTPNHAEKCLRYYNIVSTNSSNVIVQRAYAQLGKPYVWGASGPNSFDCSGLVGYCITGVYGNHWCSTYTMRSWQVVTNPQPGDFCLNSHHTGVYIGGGQMIHAPHTGDVVKISAVHSGMWYVRYKG